MRNKYVREEYALITSAISQHTCDNAIYSFSILFSFLAARCLDNKVFRTIRTDDYLVFLLAKKEDIIRC